MGIGKEKGEIEMATPTRSELIERVEELEAENETLHAQVDEISEIVGGSDGDGQESGDEGQENA